MQKLDKFRKHTKLCNCYSPNDNGSLLNYNTTEQRIKKGELGKILNINGISFFTATTLTKNKTKKNGISFFTATTLTKKK